MAANADYSRGVDAWRRELSSDAVVTDDATIARYAASTAPLHTRPMCILYPESVSAVQSIVKVAADERLPLYPISRGRNWGYGDACAPTDGVAIVDLSRMDRIHEINTELGYVTLEPGVSQRQLFEAVRAATRDYWIDATGAGNDASVVGNILDRGFGHTPYGDHMRTICGIEAVLANGRILQTGFGHFAHARAAQVYPYGIGPALDGLFSQSNFGIVTKLTLWLQPRPDAFAFFYLRVAEEERLSTLVDTLRPLRMKGLLNSAVHIGNDLRVLSGLERYPWEAAAGKTPLPEDIRIAMRRKTGIGFWNVTGSLTGSRGQVRAAARALRKASAGLGKLMLVNDGRLARRQWAVGLLQKFGLGNSLARQLEAGVPNYYLLQGVPTDAPLAGTQWRLRSAAKGTEPNPALWGCGVVWLSPVLPLRGKDAAELLECVRPLFERYGFDLLTTFTLLNERSMVAILNLSFDNRVAEDREQAAQCYEELVTAMLREGFVPYRCGAAGMPHVVDTGDTYWQVVGAVKQALDPAGIIAPGRYAPRE